MAATSICTQKASHRCSMYNLCVLLVHFFILSASYHRESQFVQGRTLGSHTAKAMLEGFMRSLTVPTKVLTQSNVLSETMPCLKTAAFLADGASSIGVRHKGTSATKAVKGGNFLPLLQDRVGTVLGSEQRSVI